jgi:pyruvate, water dikinase
MRNHLATWIGLVALVGCGNGVGAEDTSGETGASTGASTGEMVWTCQIAGEPPDYVERIGCVEDFDALASLPLDASIPGARSVKTVIDQLDASRLYFQNSQKYLIHWDFAHAHLSGMGRPIVPELGQFNMTEYYSPQRRFLLGALTYYEGPAVWTYEISPYDTASAAMIEAAYATIAENTYFGESLYFHPSSEAVETVAAGLPETVKIITTDELYAGIDYQPLNLATSLGQLRFVTADELETAYVGFRDIVVLDHVPNDISVVTGIITAEFQTPLSHINVLSQNRGTPNMGLRGAHESPELRALAGKWVELTVGPFAYTIAEVSKAEADAWWDEHKPDMVAVPEIDLSVTDLLDAEAILDPELSLGEGIDQAILAFGGKMSHFAALTQLSGKLRIPDAFGIPVYYYHQFMTDNGFYARVEDLLADPAFQDDPAVRDQQLAALRADMMVAPVDPGFTSLLMGKFHTDYAHMRMRMRSSTNAEDLEGFTGAGLYTSKSAYVDDVEEVFADLREVWSSVWYFRAFEERSYRSIDHTAVAMALLVHPAFPAEEANGVALTANPFDTSGLEPGFYVNVQEGEASVVQPESGVSTDQFIHYYDAPGQPIVFIARSNLVPAGTTVLTTAQMHELGAGLADIREFFRATYGPPPDDPTQWYAMDVEFKFEAPAGEVPALWVKQARPHVLAK